MVVVNVALVLVMLLVLIDDVDLDDEDKITALPPIIASIMAVAI